MFPDATYQEYEREETTTYEEVETLDENGAVTTRCSKEVLRPARFWFDDGKTGWVKVGVTINGIEHIENYPIMDHKNQPIPADRITSTDANKAKMRALAKACGRHGLGLYIYEGEDMPEAAKKEVSNLASSRKKVIAAAKAAIKRGVDRDAIYHLIGEMNDGNEDPNKIASSSICDQVIESIASMKPAK